MIEIAPHTTEYLENHPDAIVDSQLAYKVGYAVKTHIEDRLRFEKLKDVQMTLVVSDRERGLNPDDSYILQLNENIEQAKFLEEARERVATILYNHEKFQKRGTTGLSRQLGRAGLHKLFKRT